MNICVAKVVGGRGMIRSSGWVSGLVYGTCV